MLSKRWIVELTASDMLELLPEEQLELATCIDSKDGKHLLVYRDNFIAYKVASLTGSPVRQGRLAAKGEGGFPMGDGHKLVLEPTPKEGMLQA